MKYYFTILILAFINCTCDALTVRAFQQLVISTPIDDMLLRIVRKSGIVPVICTFQYNSESQTTVSFMTGESSHFIMLVPMMQTIVSTSAKIKISIKYGNRGYQQNTIRYATYDASAFNPNNFDYLGTMHDIYQRDQLFDGTSPNVVFDAIVRKCTSSTVAYQNCFKNGFNYHAYALYSIISLDKALSAPCHMSTGDKIAACPVRMNPYKQLPSNIVSNARSAMKMKSIQDSCPRIERMDRVWLDAFQPPAPKANSQFRPAVTTQTTNSLSNMMQMAKTTYIGTLGSANNIYQSTIGKALCYFSLSGKSSNPVSVSP